MRDAASRADAESPVEGCGGPRTSRARQNRRPALQVPEGNRADGPVRCSKGASCGAGDAAGLRKVS